MKVSFKIKGMLAAVALAVAPSMLTSCNDLLDMPSFTAEDSDFVFNDDYTADLYVQGCYNVLCPTEQYYQLNEGETISHPSEDGTTNNSKYAVANWKYDPEITFALHTSYAEDYKAIERCNIGLKYLNKMEQTAKVKALKAELIFIRAWSYCDLIRLYGDVPYIFTPMEDKDLRDETTLYPKRHSRDDIYDRIIGEMQNCVDDLPWLSESGYGFPERITRQAGLALLGRICLYAGGYSLRWDLNTNDPGTLHMGQREDAERIREIYQIANNAFEQIFQHGENHLILADGDTPGFVALFQNYDSRNYDYTAPEMMWHIAKYGSSVNSGFGRYFNPGSPSGSPFGALKAMMFMLPTYYLSFDKADTRRDVSVTPYTVTYLVSSDGQYVEAGTTYSCLTCGKFRTQWCDEPAELTSRSLDIPMIRFADVLLMYAEVQAYLNNGVPTTAGLEAFKKVRDRAGIGSMPIPTDPEGFKKALVQERKWEFSNEMLIRHDLVRMNVIADELAATRQALKDLSDRTGAYANVANYRIYKLHNNLMAYHDKFLTLDYIEVTDPNEIELISNTPGTTAAKKKEHNDKIASVLANHGITVQEGESWYSVRMFEGYTSEYNQACRLAGGFGRAASLVFNIGNIIYEKPIGKIENGGTYPKWIEASDGSDGIFYGFEKNKSELMPFANQIEGHPLIDNPNLTQHPGYAK